MNAEKYLGIDIGGTNTKIALITENGEIILLSRVFYDDFELTIDNLLERIVNIIDPILSSAGNEIGGIGISQPGLQMDNHHGSLYSVNMSILNKFDMWSYFFQKYRLPVSVINDLISHSLAEARFGTGKGVKRFLNVSLGTGIGHAFINCGEPHYMYAGISGESGRMIIDPDAESFDIVGIRGSSEALCGVKAIEQLAVQMNQEPLSAQEVISRARELKDPCCIEIMKIIARRLAVLLINLVVIYFPDRVALAGGQTEAGDFFIEECQKEFDRRTLSFFTDLAVINSGEKKQIQIVKAQAGGLAGLKGSIIPLLSKGEYR